MALGMGLVISVTVIGIGLLTTSVFRQTLVENEKLEVAAATRNLAVDFLLSLSELQDDALFLSGTPPMQGIVRATENGGIDPVDGSSEYVWRRRLGAIFAALVAAKEGYVQVRYIGAADMGRELVRVDRDSSSGRIRTVPDEELQTKGNRPYVTAAASLAPGHVYLSRMELNEEHGRYSLPFLPVVRAVVPVFKPSGDFFGAIVIKMDVRVSFAGIASQVTDRRELYVADADGHLLFAPGSSPVSLLHQGLRVTLADVFPELQLNIRDEELRAQLIGTGPNRQLLTLYRVPIDRARYDTGLIFLQAGREARITAAASSAFTGTLATGAVVLIVSLLVVTIFARSLTKPLRQMAESVEHFGRGDELSGLPTKRTDEVGDLAWSFQQMAADIRDAMTALEESERRLALTLEAGQVGLWSWTFDGDIIEWDSTMRQIFGVAQDAVIDDVRNSMSGIHPDDLPGVEHAVREAIAGRRQFNVEYRAVHDSGEIRYVSSSGHVIRDVDGEPVKFIGACKDVTSARHSQRLEQQARELARSNAALEEFAHVASHDLQEPLRTVSSYVGLLARRYKGKLDSDANDFIDFAVDGARRMHLLIENLLEYSRVGSQGKAFQTVAVADVLEDVIKGLEVGMNEADADIIVEGELPSVWGDADQLRQLLQNLISNAIKFRGERRPEIHIGARSLGDEWQINVTDNGIGIEPRFAERIFVIFQRLHSREAYAGTGIGLALCKRIVDRHGGRIWVESEPGVGSTFSFTLPNAANEWNTDECNGNKRRRYPASG